MNLYAVLILGYVTAQRLLELVIARRNTARLLAEGAKEYGAGHYPAIIAVHAAWLAALWLLAYERQPDLFWLALYVLLQAARFWVLATLGPRWTTRIIIVPGETLVREGPYRYLDHPNYWVVIGEIVVLPLVFGFWDLALVFSLFNAAVLAWRIAAENRALANR